MPVFAALTATQVGFFTTVATVIPVLLLGYVVGVGSMLQSAGRTKEQASALPDAGPRPPLPYRLGGLLLHPSQLPGPVRFFAAVAVAVVAVSLPVRAEYAAVNALYIDRAPKGYARSCIDGLIVAFAAILVPLLVVYAQGAFGVIRRQPPG
jgi:hypothetical protein